MSKIDVPKWMDDIAPGAANAARAIGVQSLSDDQHERLARLIADDLKEVWRELATYRGMDMEKPSLWEEFIAQYVLFRAAYRAPDLPQITRSGASKQRVKLAGIAAHIAEAARGLKEMEENSQITMQVADIWTLHRVKNNNPLIAGLPENVRLIAILLEEIGYVIDRAAAEVRLEGPAPVLGKTSDTDSQRTTVMRHIGEEMKRHYGQYNYGTVGALAKAALGCTDDIPSQTVRKSLQKLNQ